MAIIQLNTGNCHNCYRCIRECPVKAIEFKEGRATIIESECVLCGQCMIHCSENAQFIQNNTDMVKGYIEDGYKVYASIAPSWKGWYKNQISFEKLSAALKKIGFAGVEETAIGASDVSREYENLLKNSNMKNIIVTACSSVVLLVEKHYPKLINMLAPVSSPMMAHGRLMKEAYGSDIKVVFIGPCLSKQQEIEDPLSGGEIDTSLSFTNLDNLLNDEHIYFDDIEEDEKSVGVKNILSRLYPKEGGIIQTIDERLFQGKYTPISASGGKECVELFDALDKDPSLTGLFVEANMCEGSCLGGPHMQMSDNSYMLTNYLVQATEEKQDENPSKAIDVNLPHPRVFQNKKVQEKMPSEEEIRDILAQTGKFTTEDELNCGACGYPTCREKAIAVYQGKADINMCMPYYTKQAENLSNTVIANSPNAILVFDEELNLNDINPKGLEIFDLSRAEDLNKPVKVFMGDNDFEQAKENDEVVFNQKYYPALQKTVEQSIVYIPERKSYIMFVKDETERVKGKRQLNNMRENTVEIAQNVITKQMRVVQEIASLLGETTAETKVALTKLKESVERISQEE